MAFSEIATFELQDLEAGIATLLPTSAFSAATMYDSALANPVAVNVVVVPPPKVANRQSAVDYGQLMFKAGQQPRVGYVVNTTTPDGLSRWFLVAKILTLGPEIYQAIPVSVLTVELPYTMTVKRPNPTPPATGSLNIFGEPNATDVNGYPTLPTVSSVLHVGLTNQFNPLDMSVVGRLPSGMLTAYTYQGANVRPDDTTDFNGKHYVVSQLNNMDSNGYVFGSLLVLRETGGQSYS